ncbi:hypothetical protein AAG906_036682 [Vitis piasezkii]
MSVSAKAKSSSEGWGMGFLLVFFPEDDPIINKKKNLFSSSSSSSSSSLKSTTRIHSSNIFTRAQSTISICALIVFITLLLFTLSTFEPTTIAASSPHSIASRRWLSEKSTASKLSATPKTSKPTRNSLFSTTWFRKEWRSNSQKSSSFALQGMGCLYRRGTRAMNDLVVGHVTEDVTQDQFRMFLRALYRSSISAKTDVVLIFSSSSASSELGPVVQEETESFSRLVRRYGELNSTSEESGVTSFDVTQFLKFGKKEKERREPLWGRRIRSNYSDPNREEGEEAEPTRLRYGSMVGFEAAELDPENSLAGFLDHVPMSLRRWACYPMILGRVRRNFKHMMLVDVKSFVLLGDPLVRVRSKSTESVFLWTNPETLTPKGRKNSDKTQNRQKLVNSEIIMGGTRGVRRLSNAMLIEIVRAAMQRKGKSPFSESVLLNQLVSNGVLSKGVDLTISNESVPDSNSLAGVNSNSTSSLSLSKYSVVQRGNSNRDLNQIIMKDICSSTLDSSVYSDC